MATHLVPAHPSHERLDATVRAVVTAALAATVAVMTAGVLGWAGTPQGWLLAAAALLAAWAPLARWRRLATEVDRLPTGHLDPAWRDQLAQAVTAVERIDVALAQAPPGAVADHLAHVHATACHHLRALHRTATAGATFDRAARDALRRDQALTVRRLDELADAAERLRTAQRRHLGPDPLASLAEATDRLTASLDPPAAELDPPR